MPKPTTNEIREALLEVIHAVRPRSPTDGSLQQNTVLTRVSERLAIVNDIELEQVVLGQWQDLFRTGYLAWGHNLNNPSFPFCHVTEHGRRALENLSRDPGNPAGYLNHLRSLARLNAVASSYLTEGLNCYVVGHYKAAAVMLGGASENIVLELRDHIVQRLGALGQQIPPRLQDWRIKTILDAMQEVVEARMGTLARETREEFVAYWPAFTQQVRAVRNEAGHPTSVDPVSPEVVHASFLVFPLLAQLAYKVHGWVDGGLK